MKMKSCKHRYRFTYAQIGINSKARRRFVKQLNEVVFAENGLRVEILCIRVVFDGASVLNWQFIKALLQHIETKRC